MVEERDCVSCDIVIYLTRESYCFCVFFLSRWTSCEYFSIMSCLFMH